MGEPSQPGFRLLMVDDSQEDIFFVKTAFERSGVGESFYAVGEGAAAVAYLRGDGEYGDRGKFPFPNLILTDLKMPGMDGFDFLVWLREHSKCGSIPTIVFSSSWVERDVERAYELGANAFLTKPGDFEELVELIRRTYGFWSRCQIPAPPPGERCA